MNEQKIKQDRINIGGNIRSIRQAKNIGQTALSQRLQLMGVSMTREALVKIERGTQHISASQLKAIKEALNVTYDDLFKDD